MLKYPTRYVMHYKVGTFHDWRSPLLVEERSGSDGGTVRPLAIDDQLGVCGLLLFDDGTPEACRSFAS